MINTSITSLRKNIFNFIDQTIKYNEPINVSTKDGNVVILSQEDYISMTETIYLNSFKATKESIVEGLDTPISECILEDEVE